MDLSKKKKLAKRTLGVGEDRIVFQESRLEEIKDAITKQDIRDLEKSGAIFIKEIKGRKSKHKHKSRSMGNVHKKIRNRKRRYMTITRKMRRHLRNYRPAEKISVGEIKNTGKKIKNKDFRSKAHFKEYLGGMQK